MSEPKNALFYGDNLDILRRYIKDETVDLVYLDPPFNSNADYNVLVDELGAKEGAKIERLAANPAIKSGAQIKAFEDTWSWGVEAARNLADATQRGGPRVANCLMAMNAFIGQSNMLAYLAMMAPRLIELKRVMKPTASIYLHCDPAASHYLKLLMDAVFSPANFLNEIIWKRTHAHGSAKRFGPVHDVILSYARSGSFAWYNPRVEHDPDYLSGHFNLIDSDGRKFQPVTLTGSGVRHGDSGRPWRGVDPTRVGRHWAIPGVIIDKLNLKGDTVQRKLDALEAAGRIFWPAKKGGVPRLKWFAEELQGAAIPDIWSDIPPVSAQAAERLGYPTQKPLALLERILQASSKTTDLVFDPFCGCGTTVAAAQKLGRRWIGIDITHLAVNLIKVRLADSFGRKVTDSYRVVGEPIDLHGARELAARDKYQFQYWALGLIGARPAATEQKKGADRGIDGHLYMTDAAGNIVPILVSVKGGHVTVSQIRDLRGTLEREGAAIGMFITLEPPTAPMLKEAADAGFYENKAAVGESRHPRLQVLTIEDLLAGKRIDLPAQQEVRSFKQAPKAQNKAAKGSGLFDKPE